MLADEIIAATIAGFRVQFSTTIDEWVFVDVRNDAHGYREAVDLRRAKVLNVPLDYELARAVSYARAVVATQRQPAIGAQRATPKSVRAVEAESRQARSEHFGVEHLGQDCS